ncbi:MULTISPECIES: hypothetical protein [Nonomuraea]|uniref:Uncharacterized protein n=1 Tax=Nonomuraea mangrovi TaxID=2316207 RepID=A0ABW4T9P8_9ACTN
MTCHTRGRAEVLATLTQVCGRNLHQAVRVLRTPSTELFRFVAASLHRPARVLHVRTRLPDSRHSHSDVLAALRADPAITEQQRQVLIDVYTSFRKQGQAAPPHPDRT